MTESNPELHTGHRKRLRERFANGGLSSMEDHTVLELLLFYALPRCDTNELAHALLRTFGSLKNVFDAPKASLARIPGIGEDAALFLKLIPAVCARYEEDVRRDTALISNGEEAAERMAPRFVGAASERLVCMFLDDCGRIRLVCMFLDDCGRIVRDLLVVDEGSANSTQANIETIVAEALGNRACNVAIAHSHPNGFAVPSQADIEATVALARRLRAAGLRLCEHVIFARGDRYLMSACPRLPAGTLVFSQTDQPFAD